MYSAPLLFQRLDNNLAVTLTLCGVALIFNYLWYGEMIRLARRDKVITCPLPTTIFYLAHDGSYLLSFNKWFHEYDHWFPKLFWGAIVITFAMEVIMLAQTIRYGRKEIAPGFSQRAYIGMLLLALAGTCGIWGAIKSSLSDELYLLAFMAAIGWAAPFGTALMLRRQSRLGSSRLVWASFTMIGLPYFVCSLLVFGPEFRTPAWIAVSTVAVAWGVFNFWLVGRLPAPSTLQKAAVASV